MNALREVVRLRIEGLGNGHETTALARVRLANHLISVGRPQEAEEQALAVLTSRPSADEIGLQACDAKLRALSALGRHDEAAQEALAVLTASARIYGEGHLRTLKVGSDRVQNLIFLGKFDRAEYECRAIITARAGQGMLWLAVNNALVLALIGLDKYEEAEATARAALLQERRLAQPVGDMRLTLSLGLARSLTAQGRDNDALKVVHDAKAKSLRTRGGRSSLPGAVGVVTARALLGLGRLEEAEVEVREAVAVSDSTLSPTHHRTLEAATLLGTVLAAQGRRVEAEQQLTDCVAAWTTHFGPAHPRTVAATAELAALP